MVPLAHAQSPEPANPRLTMLTPQMEPETAPSLEAPTLAAPSATQERPPQSSYLRLTASCNPTVAVRINTPSDSRTLSVDETVNCEIRLTGAGSIATGPISVTLWCPDDNGGQGPPDRFVFLDDEGNPSKGNQLHPALQLNAPFRFRIKGRYAGASKMNVRLGETYDSSRRDFSSTSLTVRDSRVVARIQYRDSDRVWRDWGGTRSVLKGLGQNLRLRALSSSPNGAWPRNFYPTWSSSSDDVRLRVDGDHTCVVEYQQISRSTSERDFKIVTAAAANSRQTAQAIVGEVGLQRVDFRGNTFISKDDGSGHYSYTEWKVGETPAPLCYYGGQTLEAQSYFWAEPEGFNISAVKVQGQAIGVVRGQRVSLNPRFTFPARALNSDNDDVFYPLTATTKKERTRSGIMREVPTPMDTSSNVFDPLQISWQVKTLGSWSQIAYTTNKLYRTWKQPVAGTALYHTVLDVACRNARGLNRANTISDRIWHGVFKDRVVPAADGQPTSGMTYWGTYTTNGPGCFFTSDLVKHKDGRCGAWQRFFQDVLKAQGSEVYNGFFGVTLWPPAPPTYCTSILSREGNYVGTYRNNNEGYIFLNALDVPATAPAQGGIPGQHWFNNHAVVKKNSFVYDPSYGRLSDNQLQWEGQSIARYVWLRSSITRGLYMEKEFPNVAGQQETRWNRD